MHRAARATNRGGEMKQNPIIASLCDICVVHLSPCGAVITQEPGNWQFFCWQVQIMFILIFIDYRCVQLVVNRNATQLNQQHYRRNLV